MARPILGLDASVLNELLLAEKRATIGRRPRDDIQIEQLAASGEHAAIVSVATDCIPEDLGGRKGTPVNATPVKKHILRDNDVIDPGKFKPRFVGMGIAKTVADCDKTIVWSAAAPKPAGLAAAPRAAAASPTPGAPLAA